MFKILSPLLISVIISYLAYHLIYCEHEAVWPVSLLLQTPVCVAYRIPTAFNGSLPAYRAARAVDRRFKAAVRENKMDEFRRSILAVRMPPGAATSADVMRLHARKYPDVAAHLTELVYRSDDELNLREHDASGDDATLQRVQVRLIGPAGEHKCSAAQGAALPLVVYAHGGGWMFNNVDIYDAFLRVLAGSGPFVVAAADYRKAPEHRFPTPLNDCLQAIRWAVENAKKHFPCVDVDKLVIAGDSAGGLLSMGSMLHLRDQRTLGNKAALALPEPKFHALVYPALHYPNLNMSRYESYSLYGTDDYFINRDNLRTMWGALVGPKHAHDASSVLYLSPLPLLANDREQLVGLPQGILISAEYDALRDEGLEYARLLNEAGTKMEVHSFPLLHGFAIAAYQEPARLITEAINRHFASNIYVD